MSASRRMSHTEFPLYDARFEHDACGTGFVARVAGTPDHEIIRMALQCVCNLTHRGAVAADTQTGDGAGVLTQIPGRFLLEKVPAFSSLPSLPPGDAGVGMMFLPRGDRDAFALCTALVEHTISRRNLPMIGWREVPVDLSVLGDSAALSAPSVQQVFVRRPQWLSVAEFERTLYLVRKEIERHALKAGVTDFSICSFSCRTVVYKGLMIATALDRFYPDLQDSAFASAFAIYHQRYSTNTFPTWSLAQPFRMLAHNGEINTIQGNRVWTQAREASIASPLWGEEIELLKPLIQPGGSDSTSLDNVLEALTRSGRHILHTMMMLVPEAWFSRDDIDSRVKAFYEFHECISEPWDGPAALVFSDGITVGAALDRNGLRPARYLLTSDGILAVGSEVGTLDIEDRLITEKGRLGPGQMIAVDTARGLLLHDQDIKNEIASQKPYTEWVDHQLYRVPTLNEMAERSEATVSPTDITQQQVCFGYSAEELTLLFKPMTEGGKDPVGSMGDDASLAVLSTMPKLLPSYFRQQFAQVTNPPIDPIRERLIMSLANKLGSRRNWFGESPEHAAQVQLQSPVLFDSELALLRSIGERGLHSSTISILFPAGSGAAGMDEALDRICREAEEAADGGRYLIVLSDAGIDAEHAPIPILLAVGAVHNHLLRQQKRLALSVVAETGEPRDVHHFATLIGYGANAVNPYLAFETIRRMVDSGLTQNNDFQDACRSFRSSIETGLLKVMSKMGISLLGCYRGAQIFEALGISQEVVEKHFTGTPSRIGGLSLRDIAREALERHARAFKTGGASVIDEGVYRFRKNGERHSWSPDVLRAMQQVRTGNDPEGYSHFKTAISESTPIGIKDLLDFRKLNKPIPLEEVEPVTDILRRFTSAAMSLGSLSPETHETIALAMNRIGAKSNSGEGGEDPRRFHPLPNGDSANSAIKQVASGRFGVTPEYLASAVELEIKMAQGSKPGEGGQIPGNKVSPLIAQLRKSVPGVSLISPPPHHDIYSIEDLAQLIYDLKQANPRASVCVKLVSEAGVGTIAAGVAKAYADTILISGHEGGTGSSPLSSVKNAGAPWELGIAETQQVLVMNGLRERVTLRADGGLKTGRDVIVAAMLGAEEFNFGTAALIALGCKYVRQCHLNTCPVGIATQDEKLRARFNGTPEMLINYLSAVAQDVREILAAIGFRSLDDIIGRTDLLVQRTITEHPKANLLDLSGILSRRDYERMQRLRVWDRNDKPDRPLDDMIIHDVRDAIQHQTPLARQYTIRNVHRSVGTKLSGEIAYLYGDRGLPAGTIDLTFEGSAGQSFGAFLVHGVRLTLTGEANDYVGKGMAGGEIVVRPREGRASAMHEVIMGNTVLYGATGGSLFGCGRAGERFGVRNSGALAVIEGVGDHACEYMTQGTVIVLGSAGRNFGAGMTGGVAYVFDRDATFPQYPNSSFVTLQRIESDDDARFLHAMISRHHELTGSTHGAAILESWQEHQGAFWKVIPTETVKHMTIPAVAEPATPAETIVTQ
jgi:glutamate synthase domain-containing protein 2/glutamate synthase domain-containing protein 1/glutamate synthase domain-containing protein 3